ncbi:DUF5996 family protein [Flavobacteriaceae bacterium F89]|uniref:DUF5996 family protein n=1 Tax=Cerina litoralis TaxID=2874477 RepID=A0AAE3EVV7_9FLAO|nr:DUF5996 family protein [Cerina litoralis]MCG2461169.1 DUF5996 family protein [Cerina litoralis]
MEKWPILSYKKGKETYATAHMWTQIIGKIKLAVSPWINHSWHIALHLTPTGLSTLDMPYKTKNFQIDFDFINHKLKVITSDGQVRDFILEGNSVADFYHKIFAVLKDLKIGLKINTTPVEIENPIPFEKDTGNATYDKTQAAALHQALLKMQNVLTHMRCNFKGKCSPVHFFWGSFDLAVSRFSGRTAPTHPGGIPNLPNWVAEEAYSHEVASLGFWPGSEALPEAAFYAYLYPEPKGYKNAEVKPKGAYYHKTLSEFILPYSIVQKSNEPEEKLLEFLNSTYKAGAALAEWDRSALEA